MPPTPDLRRPRLLRPIYSYYVDYLEPLLSWSPKLQKGMRSFFFRRDTTVSCAYCGQETLGVEQSDGMVYPEVLFEGGRLRVCSKPECADQLPVLH